MSAFYRDELERAKYLDLVKLAKEQNVYRRYAPKAELVTKLMALNKHDEEELLSDVSMPSFMGDDTDEVSCPQLASLSIKTPDRQTKTEGTPHVTPKRKSVNFVKSPSNSLRKSVHTAKGRTSNKSVSKSPRFRRSIAGPARKSARKGPSLSPVTAKSKFQGKPKISVTITSANLTPSSEELCEQHDAHNVELDQTEVDCTSSTQTARRKLKREETFEVDEENTGVGQNQPRTVRPSTRLKRQGTFEVEVQVSDSENVSEMVHEAKPAQFPLSSKHDVPNSVADIEEKSAISLVIAEVESPQPQKKIASKKLVTKSLAGSEQIKSRIRSSHRLKRQNTYEVVDSSFEVEDLPTPDKDNITPLQKVSMPTLKSVPSADVTPNVNTAIAPKQASLLKSAPRICITSRGNPSANVKHPLAKTSGLISPFMKSQIRKGSPSVMKEIEEKKATVAATKMANADPSGSRLRLPRKIPDFSAIHQKQFDKMESLVDSKQRILERANSLKKNYVPRCAGVTPKPLSPNCVIVPAKKNVARKLISPKVLKSKLLSPKPVLKKITTPSNLSSPKPVLKVPVTPSKLSSPRPSYSGKKEAAVKGIRRLQSPKVVVPNFGTLKPLQESHVRENSRGPPAMNSRKELMKAAVTSKLPLNRMGSASVRSREVLKNVRLNKRFELQMEFRMKNKMP